MAKEKKGVSRREFLVGVGAGAAPVERDLCRPGRSCFVSLVPPEA